jgi:hypothetical protein
LVLFILSNFFLFSEAPARKLEKINPVAIAHPANGKTLIDNERHFKAFKNNKVSLIFYKANDGIISQIALYHLGA